MEQCQTNHLRPEDDLWQQRVNKLIGARLFGTPGFLINRVAERCRETYSTASVYRMFENVRPPIDESSRPLQQSWALPVVRAFLDEHGFLDTDTELKKLADPQRTYLDTPTSYFEYGHVTLAPRQMRRFFRGRFAPAVEEYRTVSTIAQLVPPELLTPRIAREFTLKGAWASDPPTPANRKATTIWANLRRSQLMSTAQIHNDYTIFEPAVIAILRRDPPFENLPEAAIDRWFTFLHQLAENGVTATLVGGPDLPFWWPCNARRWMEIQIGAGLFVCWRYPGRDARWVVSNKSWQNFSKGLSDIRNDRTVTHEPGMDGFLDRVARLKYQVDNGERPATHSKLLPAERWEWAPWIQQKLGIVELSQQSKGYFYRGVHGNKR